MGALTKCSNQGSDDIAFILDIWFIEFEVLNSAFGEEFLSI